MSPTFLVIQYSHTQETELNETHSFHFICSIFKYIQINYIQNKINFLLSAINNVNFNEIRKARKLDIDFLTHPMTFSHGKVKCLIQKFSKK